MSKFEQQVRALQADIEPSVEQLRALGSDLATQAHETGIGLFLKESEVYYVAQEVERLDRELRRAARAMREGKEFPLALAIAESAVEQRGVTRKGDDVHTRSSHGYGVDTPAKSSLRLAAAGTGSTDLLLLPLGSLVTLFASNELTAIANALAWSGPLGQVRLWLRKRRDPLAGVSATQAFEVIRSANRDPSLLLGQADAEVVLPDGTSARGRNVVITRTYPDGSSEVIEASS